MITIIPARGGSKGVKRKNLRNLCGKPLISWSIEAAINCRLVDDVFVTTDDLEISEVAKAFGAKVIDRPAYLAQDDSPMISTLQHALGVINKRKMSSEFVLLAQPTSPLRTSQHIDGAIRYFFELECKSLVSTQRVPHIFNPDQIFQVDKSIIQDDEMSSVGKLNRQKKANYFARNGAAIYITSSELIMAGKILEHPCASFEMTEAESIDIDTEFDFVIAEALLETK